MKHTPCENILWNGLPVIRKEIAERMINIYGLSQNEIAEKLCVTPAAVSQYLSGKRGNVNIIDEEVSKEINKSAERIIKQGGKILLSETCRLCKIFTSKNLISFGQKGDNCGLL
jgi:predicted transcriptional regulator